MEKEKIEDIVSDWDIGKIISYQKAKKGVCNTNWILKTTKGKYILRNLAKFKKRGELKFELNYLNYLKKNNFPYKIPSPIKTKSNKFFIKINKDYFWLYEFIEGKEIKRFSYHELKEIAKMMADYHRIIKKSKLDNKKHYSPFAKNEILKEILSFRKKITKNKKRGQKESIFLNESKKLIPLLKSLDSKTYSKLAKYPIHRDINPENTLWKNGKLIGIIDFENVSEIKETFIKDISGMLQYSCRDKKSNYKTDLELARFFIKEYKKYHKLSTEEISLIPDIIIAGAIEDFSYSYWMLLNDTERAKLYRLKLYSKVAQWHNKNKEYIINNLIN